MNLNGEEGADLALGKAFLLMKEYEDAEEYLLRIRKEDEGYGDRL